MVLGKKKLILVIAFGLVLFAGMAVYAATALFGSQSKTMNNTKGKSFSIALSDVTDGEEVLPGTELDISPAISNTSLTEDIYVFIKFVFDKDVYEITNVTGWEVVENGDNYTIYSYSTTGTMNNVGLNQSATFTAKLTVISTPAEFRELTNDDLKVEVIAYGISKDIARAGKSEAWADYGTGGYNAGGDQNDPGGKDDL